MTKPRIDKNESRLSLTSLFAVDTDRLFGECLDAGVWFIIKVSNRRERKTCKTNIFNSSLLAVLSR